MVSHICLAIKGAHAGITVTPISRPLSKCSLKAILYPVDGIPLQTLRTLNCHPLRSNLHGRILTREILRCSCCGLRALHLAAKGVVVVTVNYRLDVFGFLAHPELTKESGAHASGKLWACWTRSPRCNGKNIAAFGGDPAQVTVFGELLGIAVRPGPCRNREVLQNIGEIRHWSGRGSSRSLRRLKSRSASALRP